MYIVYKNGDIWGAYDTQAEAIAAMEEAWDQEDGIVLKMVREPEKEAADGRAV